MVEPTSSGLRHTGNVLHSDSGRTTNMVLQLGRNVVPLDYKNVVLLKARRVGHLNQGQRWNIQLKRFILMIPLCYGAKVIIIVLLSQGSLFCFQKLCALFSCQRFSHCSA